MKIVIAGTDEMFRLLNQNQVDFVYTLDRHIYHSDYVIVTESQEAVHFVTGYQNSLNGKKQILLQELICQPFILTEKEMSYRRKYRTDLPDAGKERFRNLASAGLCDRKGRTGKKTGAVGCERCST